MKTLQALNEKAWYRFLKVIYILLLILVIAVTFIIIYSSNHGFKTIDNKKTEIKCNVGNKKVFKASEHGIELSDYYFDNGKLNYPNFLQYHNSDAIDILIACGIKINDNTTDNSLILQKSYEIYSDFSLSKKEADDRWDSAYKEMYNLGDYDKVKHLKFNGQMFEVVPQFTYLYVIKLLVISILIILLIFEITRRAFYYIVLGKVFPTKTL